MYQKQSGFVLKKIEARFIEIKLHSARIHFDKKGELPLTGNIPGPLVIIINKDSKLYSQDKTATMRANLRIYMSKEYPFPSEENHDQIYDITSDQLVNTIKVPAPKGNFFKPSDRDMFFGFYSLTDMDHIQFIFSFGNKCENALRYKLQEPQKDHRDYA